ncbi:hypothetical protein [Candidatus Nitrosocosmicus sp. R]
MSNPIKNHDKLYTVISFFIASALILTPLIVSNGALAQPSNFNKLSKVEKCASGDLPSSACKKVSERSQANNGDIDAGQTGGGTGPNLGGSGNGVGTGSSTGGSNSANSAINQNQQSTQLCATGNVKALPHSTIICNNSADLGQVNNGNISTDQTAGRGLTKP